MAKIGERIRQLREAEGLSRAKMEKEAGLYPRCLEGIEQGRQEPSAETLQAIARRWPHYTVWLLLGNENGQQLNPETERVRRDSARDGTHGV